MNRKIVCSVAATLIVSASAAFGAVKEGTFTLSPMVGGYIFNGADTFDSATIFGVRGGYNFTKHLGIEAVYDYAPNVEFKHFSAGSSTMDRFGGQLLYHFFPDNNFVPYLAAGFSGIDYNGTVFATKTTGAFDYGFGAKYFLNDEFALRGDIRHILYNVAGQVNDLEFMFGASFQFGAVTPPAKPIAAPAPPPEPVKVAAAPAPPPEPVKVEPVPAPAPVVAPIPVPPADSDNDGVTDSLDKCPNTPAGVAVDATGCPIDSDRDGVADYLDKCPDTPAGVAVDAAGCPVDADKDGVADYLDKCPNTPAGIAVDATGCPVDADKDGVADYLDKCPNTPAGVVVDATGCPVDSDKDGVADYLDKCPDTAAGIQVDATGCPIEAAKKFCDKPSVIEIAFDANKAEVKGKYHDELAKLGTFLKEFPKAKGTIEGHTDADGSKEANQKLSQARAENVRSYLIAKFGIDGSRISAKGHGSAQPVASNKTAAGKAKNRRIEAVFSCE